MRVIGRLIGRTLRQRDDDRELSRVRDEVGELCAAFPPYPTLAGG
jgi:glycine/serine hydroxymethyltransferase